MVRAGSECQLSFRSSAHQLSVTNPAIVALALGLALAMQKMH